MASVKAGVWDGRPLVSANYLSRLLGVPRSELVNLARDAERAYAPFQKQRPGKTPRPIDNPREPLKLVQRRIKRCLLDSLRLPDFVCGGVRGKSVKDNASFHVGKPQVVTLDIQQFFPDVKHYRVAQCWHDCFEASGDITWLLTRLTTTQGRLPQGAPTSSGIANLVLRPAVSEISALCAARDVGFSVFVDDLALSGESPCDIINDVALILSRHKFTLARKKVRVQGSHSRQEVTGARVNVKLSATTAQREKTQAAVFEAKRSGDAKSVAIAVGLLGHLEWLQTDREAWLRSHLPLAR